MYKKLWETVDHEKIPDAVGDQMMRFIQMEPDGLIAEMRTWGSFYGRWAILCRRRSEAERLEHISKGTFERIAAEMSGSSEEAGSTLITSLWCMPDFFLDRVITIHNLLESAEE
jgi:hypothetical protein